MTTASILEGIRVLDLSRHLPGPLATLMLVDLGAEVVKIEPPAGDELREVGPIGSTGRSLYFEAANAGKRTRRLDLTRAAGREELLAMVETADVVVESFRPGVLERLGVGFPTMRARNPRLIACALNGFGSEGPLSARAGHDINYLALAGTLAGTGPRERPTFFYPPVADCSGAIFAVAAILGALYRRERSGLGSEIDLALADAVLPFHLFHLADLAGSEATPEREAGLMNGGAARYRAYRTGDGRFVSLGAMEPKFWQRFCEAAGRPDWIGRYDDPLPQLSLITELEAFFAGLGAEEARERFEPADCCFAPVLTVEEAAGSAHHRARGILRRGEDGMLQALFPAIVDGVPPPVRAPLTDESAPRVVRTG